MSWPNEGQFHFKTTAQRHSIGKHSAGNLPSDRHCRPKLPVDFCRSRSGGSVGLGDHRRDGRAFAIAAGEFGKRQKTPVRDHQRGLRPARRRDLDYSDFGS